MSDAETGIPIPRTDRQVATVRRGERDIQQVVEAGAGGEVVVTPVTVTSTAQPMPPTATEDRKSVLIQNHDGTDVVWVGGSDVAATAGNGIKIEPGDAREFKVGPALLYARTASGSAICAVMEIS